MGTTNHTHSCGLHIRLLRWFVHQLRPPVPSHVPKYFLSSLHLCVSWIPSTKEMVPSSWLIEKQAFNKNYFKRCGQGLGKATEKITTSGLVRVEAITILPLVGARRERKSLLGSREWESCEGKEGPLIGVVSSVWGMRLMVTSTR